MDTYYAEKPGAAFSIRIRLMSITNLFAATTPFLATAAVSLGDESLALSYAVFGLLAFFALAHVISTPFDSITALLLMFFLALITSVVVYWIDWRPAHTMPSAAVSKNIKQLIGFAVMLVHFIVLRAVLYQRHVKEVAKLLSVIAAVSVALSLYSAYEFVTYTRGGIPVLDFLRNSKSYSLVREIGLSGWGGLPRARALAPEPSMWGAYLLVVLGIVLPFCSKEHKRWKRNRIAVCLICLALVLTVARTAWIGAVILMIAYALYGKTGVLKKLLPLMLGLSLLMLLPQVQSMLQLLLAFGDLSARERLQTQLDTWRMFLDYPVFGVGFGAFPFMFSRYASAYWVSLGSGNAVTYNLYLTFLAETGIIGFGSFAIFLLSVMNSIKKAESLAHRSGDKLYKSCCTSTRLAFFAILFAWFSVPAYNFSYIWLILALGAVLPSLKTGPQQNRYDFDRQDLGTDIE